MSAQLGEFLQSGHTMDSASRPPHRSFWNPRGPLVFPAIPHLPGSNALTLQFASMGSCRRGFAGLRPRRVLGASRQRAVGVSSFLSSSPLLRCVIYSSVLVAMGWSRSRFREVLTEGLIHNPVNAVGLAVRCVHWVHL